MASRDLTISKLLFSSAASRTSTTIILLYIAQGKAQQLNATDTVNGYQPAAADSYGLGVRLGVYCQTLAYLIGFLNLLRLEVRSQLTGIILGFQLLIRWSLRMKDKDLSPPEAWIVLALALNFTTPGIWLLRWVFSVQRRRLNTSRKKIVKGQGFNIILSVITTVAAMLANLWFSFWASRSKGYPDIGENLIWMFKARPVTSTWVRVCLGLQAVLMMGNLLPSMEYLVAWFISAHAFFVAEIPEPQRMTDSTRTLQWKKLLKKKLFGVGLCVLFTAYAVIVALSVEYTIHASNLHPQSNLGAPGQLIPFLTGIFALVSAFTEFFSSRGANDLAPWNWGELEAKAPSNWQPVAQGDPHLLADEELEMRSMHSRETGQEWSRAHLSNPAGIRYFV